MFEKTQNIELTMHFSDVFQMIKRYRKVSHIFFNCEFKTQIVYFLYVKAIQGYIFDKAFFIALNGVLNCKTIM